MIAAGDWVAPATPPSPKDEPKIVGPAPLQQGGAPSEACPPAMKFKIQNSSFIVGLFAPHASTKSWSPAASRRPSTKSEANGGGTRSRASIHPKPPASSPARHAPTIFVAASFQLAHQRTMASRDACRYNPPEEGAANCGAGVPPAGHVFVAASFQLALKPTMASRDACRYHTRSRRGQCAVRASSPARHAPRFCSRKLQLALNHRWQAGMLAATTHPK